MKEARDAGKDVFAELSALEEKYRKEDHVLADYIFEHSRHRGNDHQLPIEVMNLSLPKTMSDNDKMNAWVARGMLDGMHEDELKTWTKGKFYHVYGREPEHGELKRLREKMWNNRSIMDMIGLAHLHQPGERIHGYRPDAFMPRGYRDWYTKLIDVNWRKHPLIGEFRRVKGLTYT